MLDKIFLNALVDVNRNHYLPIMKETIIQTNRLTSGFLEFKAFGKDKIISFGSSNFFIRDSKTLNLLDQIEIPTSLGSIVPSSAELAVFKFNENFNEIYCICSSNSTTRFCTFNLNTREWQFNELILSSLTTTNYAASLQDLFIDDEYFYLVTTSRIVKFAKENFTEIGFIQFLNISTLTRRCVDFDGSYFYAQDIVNTSTTLKKIDKGTLTVVASIDNLYTGTGSYPCMPFYTLYSNGKIFLTGTRNGQGVSYLFKINASTLSVEASRNTSAGDSPRLDVLSRVFVSSENKLYVVYANSVTPSGNPSDFLELDINTLATKSNFLIADKAYTELFVDELNDFLYYGNSTEVIQLERSYMVETYKKLKE